MVLLLAGVSFAAGLSLGRAEAEVIVMPPVVKEVPVKVGDAASQSQVIIQKVPVYLPQPQVERTGLELEPFSSLSELKGWVASNYIKDAIPGRCVDTALELCKRAWRDGYQMSTELWGDGKREGHMLCSTVIGDKIYFIEPSTGAVWLAGVKANSSVGK